MIKKPITIKNISKIKKSSTSNSPQPEELIDQWVNEQGSVALNPSNTTPETRFTIVIPTYLHVRIKKYCAVNSISMKKKIIQVFKENFPET